MSHPFAWHHTCETLIVASDVFEGNDVNDPFTPLTHLAYELRQCFIFGVSLNDPEPSQIDVERNTTLVLGHNSDQPHQLQMSIEYGDRSICSSFPNPLDPDPALDEED